MKEIHLAFGGIELSGVQPLLHRRPLARGGSRFTALVLGSSAKARAVMGALGGGVAGQARAEKRKGRCKGDEVS